MAIEGLLRHFFSEYGIGPSRIMVAVSGGADSSALLLALSDMRKDGYTISAAHVNHGIRPGESDDDQKFVEELCAAYDIKLFVSRGDLAAGEVRESGIEAAARDVRYARLRELRDKSGAEFVATAHTKRDQAETVLMRFLTGSGLSRLRGIAPVTPEKVIRPLLEADRDQILAFLDFRGVVAQHDSSNDDERFLRNRIRHEILPRLLSINPGLISTLAETARQAREQSAVMDETVRMSSREWVIEAADSATFHLDRTPARLWLVQAALARQIRRLDPGSRDVSAEDLRRLTAELRTLRRVSVSRRLELSRIGSNATLRVRVLPLEPFELQILPEATIEIPEIGKRFTLKKQTDATTKENDAFQLPSMNEGELVVRSRRPGDKFHPAGHSGETSLSDFLIERRIPREVRDSIPLLMWNGEIVSVAGVEISESFRIRDSGEEAYVIVLEEMP